MPDNQESARVEARNRSNNSDSNNCTSNAGNNNNNNNLIIIRIMINHCPYGINGNW